MALLRYCGPLLNWVVTVTLEALQWGFCWGFKHISAELKIRNYVKIQRGA